MTLPEFIDYAKLKGYAFRIQDNTDNSQTWKLTAPDGRTFGRWLHPDFLISSAKLGFSTTRDPAIVEGGMETIRCIEADEFPCNKGELKWPTNPTRS